jgi:hypothetical protein
MIVQWHLRPARWLTHSLAVICFFLACWPSPAGQELGPILRDLPLNRFPESRPASTYGDSYFMPTALGDDYFDGTSSVRRLQRHFAAARRARVKYLPLRIQLERDRAGAGQIQMEILGYPGQPGRAKPDRLDSLRRVHAAMGGS